MRRTIATALVLFALGGCSQPQKAFVDAVDSACKVILPEYEAYLDADPGLAAEQRTNRKRTAQLLAELIEEAKKE